MKNVIYWSQNIGLIFFTLTLSIFAQSGANNSISGFVFAGQNQPLNQVSVELLDEFGRLIGRVLTENSGRYSFSRIASGRYQIRVTPSSTDYEEQIQEVEIVNINRRTPSGISVFSGGDNVQKNFSLRLRKNKTDFRDVSGVIFVQEIPAEAKKLYDQAISDLNSKRTEDGLNKLKLSLEIFPIYYLALERLGQEYIIQQKFDEAKEVLKRATEINSRGFQAWYSLGYAFYSTKKYADAMDAASKAFEINATSVDALLLLGVLLRQKGQYNEAEKQLKQAKKVAKVPVPDVNWQLALLYNYNLKQYNLAADELELFLKAKPNSENQENIKKLIKQLREKANN